MQHPARDPEKLIRLEADDECPICFSSCLGGDSWFICPGCECPFHRACITPWLRCKATCPKCRLRVAMPLKAEQQALRRLPDAVCDTSVSLGESDTDTEDEDLSNV